MKSLTFPLVLKVFIIFDQLISEFPELLSTDIAGFEALETGFFGVFISWVLFSIALEELLLTEKFPLESLFSKSSTFFLNYSKPSVWADEQTLIIPAWNIIVFWLDHFISFSKSDNI